MMMRWICWLLSIGTSRRAVFVCSSILPGFIQMIKSFGISCMFKNLKHIWRTVRRSLTSGYYNLRTRLNALHPRKKCCRMFPATPGIYLTHFCHLGTALYNSVTASSKQANCGVVNVTFHANVPRGPRSNLNKQGRKIHVFFFIRQNSNIKSSLMQCFETESPTLGPVSLLSTLGAQGGMVKKNCASLPRVAQDYLDATPESHKRTSFVQNTEHGERSFMNMGRFLFICSYLSNQLDDATSLLDLLLSQLADPSCADNQGDLGEPALAEDLGVAEG